MEVVAVLTELEGAAEEVVVIPEGLVAADRIPVGVEADRSTMARSSLTRLEPMLVLVTSSSNFLMSDSFLKFLFAIGTIRVLS